LRLLSVAAAPAEIGGAWVIWQGVRQHRGLLWPGTGVAVLGFVAWPTFERRISNKYRAICGMPANRRDCERGACCAHAKQHVC
jgi:drug/metabolite transporter superfamily protein YnfA